MWFKIKNAFRKFMQGRYGGDKLSLTLLILGIILSMVTSFTQIGVFYWLGLALYFIALFRMFSRNTAKRFAENQKYLSFVSKITTAIRQFFIRIKNWRKYKYFRCPQCKVRMRLPRKVGEVTVTCSKCKNQFKKKA